MKEQQLYEFTQCTLQVLNVSTVRHTAHIHCRVTAPLYIMETSEHKAFCVLKLAKGDSVDSVQRAFRRQFRRDLPSNKSIRRWYQQFETTGCLCTGKSSGRPRVSDEGVDNVRAAFVLTEICATCQP
jgi:hypothetical protein